MKKVWARIKARTLNLRILDGVNTVVHQFQRNPYHFLYENDIQSVLFARLRGTVTGTVTLPSMITKDLSYKLKLVNSEYRKIDIVCIDEEGLPGFPLKSNKGYDTYLYDLPLFAGIELKYVTMGYSGDIRSIQADYDKLSRLGQEIKNKLAIGFFQNEELARQCYSTIQSSCTMVKKIQKLDGIFVVSPSEIREVLY